MEAGTITRRLDSALNRISEAFQCGCTEADFIMKIGALRDAELKKEDSRRSSLLAGLYRMLDRLGVAYERGQSSVYYTKLIRTAKLPSFADVERQMMRSLFETYDQYPSPEEYIARIVRKLAGAQNQIQTDSTRLRILKQFILAGDYLSSAGYGGRLTVQRYIKEKTRTDPSVECVLSNLDDGVFNVLEDASKAQRRPEGKYGLLKLADDLAMGKFRAEGATKQGLYLFAIVFGMRYDISAKEETWMDIDRSLFRDYYTNNLVRFITDAYWKRKCEYEQDPSGQGINYKNYAEMVYLYYLNRNCTPQEKIKRASEMIKRIADSQFDASAGSAEQEEKGRTKRFRALFTEDVLALPETEFESFLCRNYDCNTYSGISYQNRHGAQAGGKRKEIQVEMEQKSAYETYWKILDMLQNRCGLERKDCSYGLWFADIRELRNKARQAVGDSAENTGDKWERFVGLLASMDGLLGGASAQNRGLPDVTPKSVTRCSIIAAYYYYYNAVHEDCHVNQGAVSADRWKNFDELFRDFQNKVNPYLEKSYYQSLDGRNLFDILVVFSSYAYLNL